MKKGLKKISLFAVAIFILTSVLAGCGSKDVETAQKTAETKTITQATSTIPGGPDTSKEVKLKMYLLGDKAKDSDLVYGEINKLLKQDINATVEVSFMGWGDYQQKYPLVFASGEDFDVIYTADWAFYNAQATKGGFMEITQDLLKQYAPKTAETIYKDAWEQAKINGKVYMLPMNYKEMANYVFLLRGDLMEKYGVNDVKSLGDFEKYLDAVAKNEKQLIPLDIGSDFDQLFAFDRIFRDPNNLMKVGPMQLGVYADMGDTSNLTVSHAVDNPKFLESVKMLKEWKDKGYWSKSAIVNKMTSKESFLNGKSSCAILNLNDAQGQYNSLVKTHPDWKLKVFDAQFGKSITITPYIGNGMAIFEQSKNKERALMFLDLLRNDERYADLVAYGIKGKHYDLTADGKVKPLADTANYPIDGNCNWGLRNDKFWKVIDGGIPNFSEIHDSWEKVGVAHPLLTLNFDDSMVKNEVATIYNIYKTDYKALVLGFTKDPEADVEKLQDKLKAAGKDKVVQEMQAQIKATYGK